MSTRAAAPPDPALDVVRVAWMAAGSPVVITPTATGECGRCRAWDDLVPAGKVVTRRYTGVDSWTGTSRSLCPACVWSYRERDLIRRGRLVDRRDTSMRELSGEALREVLAVPVGPDVAVVVPATGRKHVLQLARWGRVGLDEASLTWGPLDGALLEVLERMRSLGCTGPQVTEPAPPWRVLARLSIEDRSWVMREWGALDPWRRRRPWLDLGLIATAGARQPSAGS